MKHAAPASTARADANEPERVASMQRSGIEDHGVKPAAQSTVWFALANRVLMGRRRTELRLAS